MNNQLFFSKYFELKTNKLYYVDNNKKKLLFIPPLSNTFLPVDM